MGQKRTVHPQKLQKEKTLLKSILVANDYVINFNEKEKIENEAMEI